MREIVTRFFSELHRDVMKPLGFRKERTRFVREMQERIEIIDFRGCSWNSSDWALGFYISVAVGFCDLQRIGKPLWFNRAHALGRIEDFVDDVPPDFDLDEDSYSELMHLVPKLVKKALEVLPTVLPRAHARAKLGLLSPLPVPNTWNDVPEEPGNDSEGSNQ